MSKPLTRDEIAALEDGTNLYYAIYQSKEIKTDEDLIVRPVDISEGELRKVIRKAGAARKHGYLAYITLGGREFEPDPDGNCEINDKEGLYAYIYKSPDDIIEHCKTRIRENISMTNAMTNSISETFARLGCSGVQIGDTAIKAVHPLEKVLGREPTPGEKHLFEEGVKYGRNGG